MIATAFWSVKPPGATFAPVLCKPIPAEGNQANNVDNDIEPMEAGRQTSSKFFVPGTRRSERQDSVIEAQTPVSLG